MQPSPKFTSKCSSKCSLSKAIKISFVMLHSRRKFRAPIIFFPWLHTPVTPRQICYLSHFPKLYLVSSLFLLEGRAGTAWEISEHYTSLFPPFIFYLPLSYNTRDSRISVLNGQNRVWSFSAHTAIYLPPRHWTSSTWNFFFRRLRKIVSSYLCPSFPMEKLGCYCTDFHYFAIWV